MARPTFGRGTARLSKRDSALQRRAMDMHYAALAGVEPVFAYDIEIPDAPKKRVAKAGVIYERDVQKTIMEWLGWHPRVAWRIRINSGEFVDGSGNHVRTHFGLSKEELISDIIGQLRGGQMFAIEVKKPGWVKPSDERERKQANFHGCVRANGGVAFFAVDLDDAKAKLAAVIGETDKEEYALI